MTNLDGYVLRKLSGQPYLLPYGQNIATFRRGLKLNETGELICRALQEGKTKEELPAILAEHFEADQSELPILKTDIEHFLAQLHALGITGQPSPRLYFPADATHSFRIGTITLQLNMEEELISKEFFPFQINAMESHSPFLPADAIPPADLTVSVHFVQPVQRPVGKILVHNEELLIMETDSCYGLIFLTSPDISVCYMDKKAHTACFYCRRRNSETLREELFHGIRFAFLLAASRKGLYAIHSASILYKEKAWLFSAPSGTGKSTHAKLWQEQYDTPPLNGDLNLLGMEDGKPVVYGLPWCGTSGIFTEKTYALGGVIFLQRDTSDHVRTLTPDARSLMLSQRLISPTWTREMLGSTLDFCEQLASLITSFTLCCTAKPTAANVCRAAIDTALLDRTAR
ncbi:MAG: PqqD family protein [Lachnospiraceae bacterium]|nr:PqqD family protein [Lachnospiraceae bacterium]